MNELGIFIENHQAIIALAVLALVFIGFLFERFIPAVIALVGAGIYLVLGFLEPEQALSAFSNSAPITIAAMFILSGALIRTGSLEAVTSKILTLSDSRPRLAIILVFIAVFFASAIMNNTPVVLVSIPILVDIAKHLEISKKRFLMPLSFVAILGGSLTLVGTSSNLLVDGVARKNGLAPFGIFEITEIGLFTAAAGIVCILVLGLLLLPKENDGPADDDHDHVLYLTNLKITPDSSLIGKAVQEVSAFEPRGVNVVYIHRGSDFLKITDEPLLLQEGDQLVVRATTAELLSLHGSKDFTLGLASRSPRSENIEALEILVTSNHMFVGKGLLHLPLLSRYRMRVLGLARAVNQPGPELSTVKVRVGDRLLIEADRDVLREIASSFGVVAAGTPSARPFRRRKGVIAVSVILGVVALAAMGVMPISALAMIGVGVILFTRVLDAEEAWTYLDGNVLVLIVTMLMMGTALENTGAVKLLADLATPLLQELTPFALLLSLYLLTSIMTETVTNNAVAVIMTPIAIELAHAMQLDPRSLVIAVMFGASASFATPIGYQTNTLVYSAGKYSFFDFLKIGVIMNIVVGLTTCAAIYWLRPV